MFAFHLDFLENRRSAIVVNWLEISLWKVLKMCVLCCKTFFIVKTNVFTAIFTSNHFLDYYYHLGRFIANKEELFLSETLQAFNLLRRQIIKYYAQLNHLF